MNETRPESVHEATNRIPKRHGAPWENEEFHTLIKGIIDGLSLTELADHHQRTCAGISWAAMRLIPPSLLPDSHTQSIDVLARYLHEAEKVDRQLMVAAICPAVGAPVRDVPVLDPENRPTPMGQSVLSDATVSKTDDDTQAGDLRETFTANAEPSVNNTSCSDVTMLVSAAVTGISRERVRNVLEKRLGMEELLTLAEIGAEWDISGERVRQIQERGFRWLAARARIEGTPGATLKKLLEPISNSPDDLVEWLVNIVRRDFMISQGLAARFILCTAGFPKRRVLEIVARLPRLERSKKMRLCELDQSSVVVERIESVLNDWLKYSDWPLVTEPPPPATQLSAQRIVNDSDIAGGFYSHKLGRMVQFESGLEFNILSLLERSERVAYYQEQPVVIPYTYNGKEFQYYPDLFVATVDGRGLLVEVKPTDYMALSFNRAKAVAGRAWAHARGWGWLIVNDNHTFRQLKEHHVPASIWTLIDSELNARGVLTWRDLATLRAQHGLTRLDLTAYIIQSGAELDRAFHITSRNVSGFL